MVVLLAESGSSKTDWALFDAVQVYKRFTTAGINPYFYTKDSLQLFLRQYVQPSVIVQPNQIKFYGAGCGSVSNQDMIRQSFMEVFDDATTLVDTDMLAAAKALCGNKGSVTAILGTGTNTCLYDGENITGNKAGIGYVLGDDGSGAALGRAILRQVLYRKFDEGLLHSFSEMYPGNATEILENIYKKPFANQYLAQFSKFAYAHQANPAIKIIIEQNFEDFVQTFLKPYDLPTQTAIHFVGSIAYYFKDILAQVLENNQYKVGKVLKEPMESLITVEQEAIKQMLN